MRKLDIIEAKFALRAAPIERKMDQLLAKVASQGDSLSQSERDAIRAQYEQLENELKEIEEEMKIEYDKK